jgi:uncharacterized protein (DUF1800 family)
MYRCILVISLAACAEQAPEPSQDETAAALTRVAAGRLLDQATFGPRPHVGAGTPAIDTVEHVLARGVGGAVTDQLDAPAGSFAKTPPLTGVCDAPFDPAFDLGAQFFHAAMRAKDQLRLRTMFALHQILVVSENGINEIRTTCNSERRDAMARYLNALRAGAFGSYRDLLETIALEPAMGTYLDMGNNVAFKTDGTRLTPNENFARELLQLFTLGTSLLAEDGTVLTDAGGKPRPAYSEARVQAFARTLTGWTYAGSGCPTVGGKRTATYNAPMIPCDVNHDDRAAQLLTYTGAANGGLTTAGATTRAHLDEALDNLFDHPNLPPFICKQLIQHLVTSNPSRAYVKRIVDVFKDDGTTVHRRGNLRAVVRAILLDAEARSTAPAPAFGRLRAPAEMITRILRSFGTTLDLDLVPGRFINSHSASLGQFVPRPPSVFSYYPPSTPLGGNFVGPEFGLLDTGTIATRANFMHALLHGGSFAASGVNFDLDALPDAIIPWIDEHWMHGTMSPELHGTLTNAVDDPLANTPLRKKQLALYLAALSPEFQIQR